MPFCRNHWLPLSSTQKVYGVDVVVGRQGHRVVDRRAAGTPVACSQLLLRGLDVHRAAAAQLQLERLARAAAHHVAPAERGGELVADVAVVGDVRLRVDVDRAAAG